MIAYVKGILAQIETDSCIVEAGGIGYQIITPVSEELLRVGVGNEIVLYTYFCVREDAQLLYGFLRQDDLKLFKQLINVNGVGPRYAMAILSQMNPDSVIMAIAGGDYKALTKVSGIGTKTAQRIVVDLKDKVASPVSGKTKKEDGNENDMFAPGADISSAAVPTATSDAMAVLLTIGFSKKEAETAISKVYAPDKDAQTLVNEALKLM